jgi:hypothetical protein
MKDLQKLRKITFYCTEHEWKVIQNQNKFITKYFKVSRNEFLRDILIHRYNPKIIKKL